MPNPTENNCERLRDSANTILLRIAQTEISHEAESKTKHQRRDWSL